MQSSQHDQDDEESGMPARSQGCTGAAKEELVAKFRVDRDCRFYTAKPRADPMDVTNTPVTACRACKNAGRGVKPHWFHECPGFD